MTTTSEQPAVPEAPEALRPPPGNPRFPLLDAMRAVAALLVVLTHTAAETTFNQTNWLGQLTARADIGVALFFLLSGFLLYRPYVASRREDRPRIEPGPYARRRFLRIVPAYWVALTILAIYPGLLGFSEHWLRLYSFTQIYWIDSGLQGIAPAWSLCVEVTFYILLPLVGWLTVRARPSVRVEIAVLAALGVASMIFRQWLLDTGTTPMLRQTILSYFAWFAIGMILAIVSVATHHRQEEFASLRLIARRPWVPWLAAAVLYVILSTCFDLPNTILVDFTSTNYNIEHVGYGLIAALMLLPAIFGDFAGGWPRRFLALRWMAWLGLISYGIFLWHLPIVQWMERHHAYDWLPAGGFVSLTAMTLLVVIPIAAASYYLVEKPALSFKDGFRRRKDGA